MACVTGDETGIVKIWDITHSSAAPLLMSHGEQSRSNSIVAMCWVDGTTTEALLCRSNGNVSVLHIHDKLLSSTIALEDVVAGSPSSTSVVDGKLCLVTVRGGISMVDWSNGGKGKICGTITAKGPATAVHIQRRLGLAAIGGKDNNLAIWDLRSERTDTPLFAAENIQDHILEVPYPLFICGACIVSPSVYAVATALSDVRFFDARVSRRPVQVFQTSREMDRRATTLVQWNCNKFLIGETSGDIHLYDTRRGFASRAKFRGGVGSVRQIVKHPAGHKIIAVIGLDRKARMYHVPTGRLIQAVYVKQRGNCVLLDKGTPYKDQIDSFDGKLVGTAGAMESLGSLWDEMDPVCDDVDVNAVAADAPTPKPVAQNAAAPERPQKRKRVRNS